MKIPPPLCRRCLEAADLNLFYQAGDGLVLLHCPHLAVLVRVTVADHVPVHWVADHPVTPEAAAAQLAELRGQAHQGAN
jgi:hypothetical protein